MVTMYKTVYRDVYVDDMTEETREVNCAEFTTDKAHAYERFEVWSRNGQGVGVFVCHFDEEFIDACKRVQERLQHTGEFGFSLRRRIRREAREQLLPVRTKENKRQWYDMSDYLRSL